MGREFYVHQVLLVTGSVPRAEEMDRPLAYFLKQEIDRRAGLDPRRKAVVVGDLWYLQNAVAHNQPTISVGGPAVNALSAAFYRALPVALAVEDLLLIQMDPALKDLRAAVWGIDHEHTRVAVATFAQERFLGAYLKAAWGKRRRPA